jgi:beta-mannosidase
MLRHQKSHDGNQILETYLEREFRVPARFDAYVYATQSLNATITAASVEHFRRQTGTCMGYLAWQLNDCWPAVSWSGVDYGGRWKAQQYSLKRAFTPVMISSILDDNRVRLYVNNDTPGRARLQIDWSLLDRSNQIVTSGATEVEVPSQSVACVLDDDFADHVSGGENGFYLTYSASEDGIEQSAGLLLFCAPKHYCFDKPGLEISVADRGDHFELSLLTDTLIFALALELKDCDATFSDNYFHLVPGRNRTITLQKSALSRPLDAAEIAESLIWMSAFDLQVESAETASAAVQ